MTELRPYQERALQSLSKSFRTGHRAPLLVAPTGAGKTVMAGTMCARHLSRAPTNRVVWLAHRSELQDQAAATLSSLGVDLSRATVASIQTLVRRSEVPPATLVIQDEAHHQASDKWSVLNTAWGRVPRVGLTATPQRGDGRGLACAFDDIVVAATPRELTEMGFLVPCITHRPGKLLRSKHVAQEPVDAYREHANGRQAVVFCKDVVSCEHHLSQFRDAGIRAAMVTDRTPWAERCATIQAFREGRGQILLNVHVLTEGFDAPETSCVIIARGCGHAGLYVQMVGRGLRPAKGKADCIFIDLRGVSHIHGEPIADREYTLDGKGIRLSDSLTVRFCKLCKAVLEPGAVKCPDCGKTPEPLEPPKVTGDKLEAVSKWEVMSDKERVGRLAYWIRDARVKGHNPYAPFAKFQSVFKTRPSDYVRREAERMAR